MKESSIALYIQPSSHHFLEDRLFNEHQVRYGGDHLMAPYTHLKKVLNDKGIEVHTADLLPQEETAGRQIVYVSLGNIYDYKPVLSRSDTVMSAFIAFECPIVDPDLYLGLGEAQRHFNRIYSWSDSESLKRFTGQDLSFEKIFWPQSFDTIHEDLWQNRDRKFMAIINSNKLPSLNFQELYSARVRAVEYFARTDEIDLYGREWDKAPHKLRRSRLPYTFRYLEREWRGLWQKIKPDPNLAAARRVYRGSVPSKSETFSRYTFALCFENMILNGWITEKIFDCFYTGTIPIYWGDPQIEQHIPAECFIDMRRFADFDELSAYLHALSPQDIQSYRESARDFLTSPAFKPFSKDAFAAIFIQMIEEDLGLKLTEPV